MYLAEALLYSDKINDSIETLNLNTKIEAESDISFVASSILLASNQSMAAHNDNSKSMRQLFSNRRLNE